MNPTSIIKIEDEKIPLFYDDKVIALKNTEDYCNGDIGYVKGVTQEGIYVHFEGNDSVTYIENKHREDIELAYCLSVHKMQGSECEEASIFLPEKQTSFITKRLIYTAVTRAKKEVHLYFYQ